VAQDSDQEKTESATPKKRAEARKKGQLAHSREIPSVLVLLSSMGFFFFAGSWMFWNLVQVIRGFFQTTASIQWSVENLHIFLWQVSEKLARILLPFAMLIMLAGIIGNICQVGFLLTSQPLSPKFSKLNPINGLKRLVSLRSLIEMVKAAVKLSIVGWVSYIMVKGEMEAIPALIRMDVLAILNFIGKVALRILFATSGVMVILAGLDYLFQRWQHEKDLKMTKQEIRDEHKQAEGDPAVKSRIRSVQREMARRRMMEAVPGATVVITNPTHLAIALKFENSFHAPVVVAKGAGYIAERIRSIAKASDIPIVEQKSLARALYKSVEIGQFIPAELYRAVAEILAYVYRLKGLVHNHSNV
jgi:flagellar biosynthetic protein FlhB